MSDIIPDNCSTPPPLCQSNPDIPRKLLYPPGIIADVRVTLLSPGRGDRAVIRAFYMEARITLAQGWITTLPLHPCVQVSPDVTVTLTSPDNRSMTPPLHQSIPGCQSNSNIPRQSMDNRSSQCWFISFSCSGFAK